MERVNVVLAATAGTLLMALIVPQTPLTVVLVWLGLAIHLTAWKLW